MINVIYYTSTNLIDAAIETIQCIKTKVNLHVFIEITNYSKCATIINVNSIDDSAFIMHPELLLGKEQWTRLKPYFSDVKSVHFLVFKNKKNISFQTILSGIKFGNYLKKLSIDVFHFDTISLRALGFLSYLKNKKVVIALHDAVPHTGENSWKEKMLTIVFYKMANSFLFYSKYSMNQFNRHFNNIHKPVYDLFLQPYSFNRMSNKSSQSKSDYILFFGRLSYYKGIDILLEAIPAVFEKNPKLSVFIIGKKVYDFKLNNEILKTFEDKIKLITGFMPNDQLIDFIRNSKFVVCPYRDASQSGVLMTATSLRKMTVAANVGAFKEYIQDDFNGMLCEPNSTSLANKINEALFQDKYKQIENNIDPYYSNEKAAINSGIIMSCYLN